jgi:hypothetical protein
MSEENVEVCHSMVGSVADRDASKSSRCQASPEDVMTPWASSTTDEMGQVSAYF